MLIPKPLVERFKSLYLHFFNEQLSDEDAQKQGIAIMRIIAIYKLLEEGEKKNAK